MGSIIAGWFVGHLIAPEGATIRYSDSYAQQLDALLATVPEIATTYTVVARGSRPTIVNRAASYVSLTDWDLRARTQQEIVAGLSQRLEEFTGVKAYFVNPPPMDQSANKTPVQFVIGGPSYDALRRAADRLGPEG
ncbi:MAG: hypothetical protein C4293_15305 [Nitrospiraceae bacterium]